MMHFPSLGAIVAIDLMESGYSHKIIQIYEYFSVEII